MKIEYLKIKNFLSVGEEPVEIDFTKLGRIVLVEGRNLDFQADDDYADESDQYHSNGAGKSTISEALVYGLYGSTVRKKVSHTDAINNISKKKLEVEIIFSIDGTRYRIIRTRKPDTLSLWQDGPPWATENNVSKGGIPAVQKQIDDLLHMNHKAFVNVVCFGQHNDYNFLECSASEQRDISESLLSLEVFQNYCETAKNELKSLKSEFDVIRMSYDKAKTDEELFIKRVAQIEATQVQWQKERLAQNESYQNSIEKIKHELASSDIGQALERYEHAQEAIAKHKADLDRRREQETDMEQALRRSKEGASLTKEKLHELTIQIRSVDGDIADFIKEQRRAESEKKKLEDLPEGAKCPHCYGTIDKQHYKHVLNLHQNKIDALKPKIESANTRKGLLQAEAEKYKQALQKIDDLTQTANRKLGLITSQIQEVQGKIKSLSSIERPDLTSREVVLVSKIKQIEEAIQANLTALQGGGPYKEILANTLQDLENAKSAKEGHRVEMQRLELVIPYYQWWVKGFGDDGVKSFIIENIVPALNARIDFWLQYLIKGKMKVTFDKYLNATIESNPPTGDPYAYFATCGGERRRINLAISQAFAHVMMLSSGTWPSLVFLDEVSDSIDQKGIRTIYQMICELSNDKQVFVITHNIHLREMLKGVDRITMVRKNGHTKRLA